MGFAKTEAERTERASWYLKAELKTFFLAALVAIGCEAVRLEDI